MVPAARTLAGDAPVGAVSPRLVPVPLSPSRRRRRGFNQAALLAGSLGRRLGWEVGGHLRRDARGRPQARLGGASRRENVRGLFRAGPRRAPDVAGVRSGERPPALVVDDVVTTGSTAAACAAALRQAGWRPLGAVTFARAVAERPTENGGSDAESIPPRSAGSGGGWHTSRDG